MKKFQNYDMDDALPVGAVEEGMEYGEDILPPPRNSEEQKKKSGWQNKEKRQPYDWELKGCETIEDSAEKEKFKKELEKKERQRQYYAKWYAKQKEKKAEEKAAKEKKTKEPKKQEKLQLEDLRETFGVCGAMPAITEEPVRDLEEEYVEQVVEELEEEPEKEDPFDCDAALMRLEKLRRLNENDGKTDGEAAALDAEDEPAAVEEETAADAVVDEGEKDAAENGRDAAEDGREDSEMDADERTAERTEEMKESLACCGVEDSIPFVPRYYLELSASQAESLKEFIEDHLIDDIRNDPEINNLDWIADMCEIWREMSKWHIKKSSD